MDETASINRRLPVYLLLDCSGSMAGDPIQAVEMGLRSLLNDLRQDPYALDTVWLSLITFSSVAELIAPLTDINEFGSVELEAEGGTALGAAIELLTERIDQEVRRNSAQRKGDWKPLVFILTDGDPRDDWEAAIDRFRAGRTAQIIACGAGPDVRDATLRRLGDQVIRLSDTQPGTLGSFMQRVSVAVSTASQVVGTGARDIEDLISPPEDPGTDRTP